MPFTVFVCPKVETRGTVFKHVKSLKAAARTDARQVSGQVSGQAEEKRNVANGI